MKLAPWMVALALGWAGLAGSAAAAPTIVSQGPALQLGGDRFVLHSERVGRDFLVEVTAPATPALPGQKLPQIYALDSGYGVAGQSARILASGGGASPAYVISVGYVPNTGDNRFRDTDLLHTPTKQDGKSSGGGGEAFEAFLLEELRPFIEARYPVDPQKAILEGHSYGGLFAATVLARKPTAFWAYLIGSPSIWAAPDLPDRVRAVAKAGGGRKVFVSVGGGEPAMMGTGEAQLVAALTGPGSTFVVRQQVFEGLGHLPSYLMMAPAGLPFLLPPPPPPAQRVAIAVDPAVLDRYVGVYRLDATRTVTITRQGAKLFGELTGLPQVELSAETPTAFFTPVADAQTIFTLGPDGKARSLVLRLNGAASTAPRVK